MQAARCLFAAAAAGNLHAFAAGADTVAMLQTQTDPPPPILKDSSLAGELNGIRYSAKEVLGRKVEITFEGPGMSVDITIDCETKGMRFVGGESTITKETANSFTSIHNSFIPTKGKPRCAAPHLLQRATAYLAMAPAGFSLGTFELPSKGIKCREHKEVVEAAWNDENGEHKENVTVGSTATVTCFKDAKEAKELAADYECMGNCGPGCWSTKAHIRKQNVYTEDCMNHDKCSAVNCATGGKDDKNCGDEWQKAMDDYLVGILVCDSHIHIPGLGDSEK